MIDAAQRGFTLIELLVVISIIALLISILHLSLGKARKAAWQAAHFYDGHAQYLKVFRGGQGTLYGPGGIPKKAYVNDQYHLIFVP